MTPSTRPSARDLTHGRSAVVILMVAVVVACGARLIAQSRYPRFGSDSFHYLLLAESIADGEGFVSGGSQHPDLSRPPLFPALVAAATVLTGAPEATASFLVALWGALVIVPLFFLAREMFGPAAALAALALGAASCLTASGLHLYPTAVYTLMFVTSAAVAWMAFESRLPGPALVAGMLAGAAALARPDGLFLPVALVLWAASEPLWVRARQGGRRRGDGGFRRHPIVLAGSILAGALLVYTPYAVWASIRLQRWSPAPSIEYVMDMRLLSDRLGLRALADDDVSWEELARFTLASDHRRFVLDSYFADGVLEYPEPDRMALSSAPNPPGHSAAWTAIVKRRLFIVYHNLEDVARGTVGSHFAPVVPVLLGLMGIVANLGTVAGVRRILFVATLGVISLVPAASHVEARFLVVPFALSLLLSAAGWGHLAGRLSALARPTWIAPAVHVGLAVLVGLSGVRHLSGHGDRLVTEALQREVAALASKRTGPGPMLARTPYIPYWAGRSYRPVPLGDPDVLLDYARHQGAQSLVLQGNTDLLRRPELEPLSRDPLPPGFRLLYSAAHPAGGEVRLFELVDP